MPERRARSGATASGASAGAGAAVTPLNLRCGDGRGRFSGTKLSSELARHGGHRLRSLHRGASTANSCTTLSPPSALVEATTASRATAMLPASAIPTTAHAAAATHARRNDPPDHGAVVVTGVGWGRAPPLASALKRTGGLREQLMEEIAMLDRLIAKALEQFGRGD